MDHIGIDVHKRGSQMQVLELIQNLQGGFGLKDRIGVTITVVYERLIKQKQYSSRPPEPSPGARKCSLSTMWL
jgi:hypothetical protein